MPFPKSTKAAKGKATLGEVFRLEDKIEELEKELEAKNKQIAANPTVEEMQTLQGEVSSLKAEKTKLETAQKAALAEAEGKVQEQKEIIETLTAERLFMQQKLQDAEDLLALSSTGGEVPQISPEEVEELRNSIAEHDAKIAELTQAIDAFQKELKEARKAVTTANLQVANANRWREHHKAEREAAEKRAIEAEERATQTAQEAADLSKQIKALEKKEKSYLARIEMGKKLVESKNRQLESKDKQLADDQTIIAGLEDQLARTKNSSSQMQRTLRKDVDATKNDVTEARKRTLSEKLGRKKAEDRATQAEDAQRQAEEDRRKAEEARDVETARANAAETQVTETQTKLTKTTKTNGLLKKIGIPLVVTLGVAAIIAGSFWGVRTVQAKEWEAKYGKETVQTTVAEIVGDYNQVDNDALYADMIDELVNGGKEKQAYKLAAVQTEDTTITDYQMIKATEEASDLILTLDETKTVSETSALGTAIKNYNAAADAEDKSGMKKYADEISGYSETMESYATTTNEKLGNMLATSELVSKAQVDVLIAQERDDAYQEGIAQGKADAEAERAEKEFVLSTQEVSAYLSVVAPNAGSVGDVYCYYQNGYVTIIAEDCLNMRTMQTYTAYQQFKIDPNSLSDVTVSEIMDAVKTEKSGWDMVETLETSINGSTVTMTIDGEEITGTAEVLFGYKQQGKSYKGSALVVIRDDAGNIIGNKIIAESTLSKSLDEIKTLVSEKVNNMYSNSVEAETENDME